MVKTRLKCAGSSDPGRVRANNEDSYYVDADRGIFLVVDGIGGQAAGEKAAEIAVARIRARLERQTGTAEQRVTEAITVANNEIFREAQAHPDWAGMACVLTVVVLENGSAVAGHVGDSRLYKIRQGAIEKLTHDHSPIGEREDSGELTEAEAMRHPRRNEVFRDVGSEEHAPGDPNFIEVLRFPFEPESALLLCSDGLSDQVSSAEIRRAVERHAGDPDRAIQELIEAANRAGGKDNVTVLLVEGEQFTARPLADPLPESRPIWSGRPAVFLYGMLLALGAAWLARDFWQKPPEVITPRVLSAGQGGSFATIQEALAEARPGDTVDVLAGEYREPVRLKTGVAIRSHLPHEAILRAAPVGNAPALSADAVKDSRVDGFRILADAEMPLPVAILLVDSEVTLDDLEIAGAGTGVEIRGTASPLLRSSSIHDCTGEGVLIMGASKPWLSHNVIAHNARAGVAARDSAEPLLLGNVFDNNTLDLGPAVKLETIKGTNLFLESKPARTRQEGGRKK